MTGHLCNVEINEEVLIANYSLLCKKNKAIMPIIKNNAYGHGLISVAKALQKAGCERIGVGPLNEAIALREAGIKGMLVPLLSCLTQKDFEDAIAHDLYIILHNFETLELAIKNKAPKIIIKMNTGMNRLGFLKEDLPKVIEQLKAHSLNPYMIMSHYSSSDVVSEEEYTRMQSQSLQESAELMKQAFPDCISSLGNSAGTLAYADISGDLLRPGIILYGGNPFYGSEKEALGAEFKDAMTVSAPILSVHKLDKGESMSYGRSYVAQKDMMVAWVGIGYADGYKRVPKANDADGKGGIQVLLHGKRCPVLGRVNMQMTAIDVTDLMKEKEVRVGDKAILLGGTTENRISADELARWWGTIPHEVFTTFGKLV